MVKQQHIVDAISRLKYIKRQGKFSEEKTEDRFNRIDYIEAEGKYSYKANEFKGGKASHRNYSYLFKCLEKQFSKTSKIKYNNNENKRYTRIARELIIPIPQCLKNNIKKQYEFIDKYIELFKKKYNLGNEFLYLYGIHNKEPEGKKLNLHAHFIFSERPLLNEPIHITTKTRYFDSNNRECRKSNAVRVEKGKNKTLYFGKKYTDLNILGSNKQIFHSYKFCNEQDFIWKETVLSLNIMTKDQLLSVFKNSFHKHFPDYEKEKARNANIKSMSSNTHIGRFMKRKIVDFNSYQQFSFDGRKAWHEIEEEMEKKKERNKDEGR